MKMIKKILNLFAINLVIIVVLFVSIEFIIYKHAVSEYYKFYNEIAKLIPPPSFLDSYKAPFHPQTIQYFKTAKNLEIRPFEINKDNVKKPILLFGCSFTHGGVFLNDEQTVSHKLSMLTKRNVYNFAMCGCGFQQMLYIIQNYLDKYISKNEIPEYAMYFYIPNQIQRLRVNIFPGLFFNGTVLHYKINGSELEIEKRSDSFFYRTFLAKSYYYNLDRKRELDVEQDKKDNFEMLNRILLEMRKELQDRYPNIKFVVVRYQIENDDTNRELPDMWQMLEKEGFTIINSEDLIGRKFKYFSEDTNDDKYHPSEKAWDTLLPPLIKKLNL